MYTYKKRNIIIMCCMLLVFTLTAFSIFANNTKQANAVVPEGEQAAVGGDSVTMYYLSLPVKNEMIAIFDTEAFELGWKMSPNTTFMWNLMEDCGYLTNNRVHTFIFTYNNITVNGKPLLTTWNIECTTEGWCNIFGGHLKFFPKDDININIRSEYYELFQNGDFSDVTITYMFGGRGYRMKNNRNTFTDYAVYNFSGATLHTRQVSPDYDPIEAEGQAPDNGGIALDPNVPLPIDILDTAKNILKDIFKSTTFYILLIVGAVVVVRFVRPKK